MDGQILHDQLAEQDVAAIFDGADVELEHDDDDYLLRMSDADRRLAESPLNAATLAALREAQAQVRRGEVMTLEESEAELERDLEEWLKVNQENHDE